MSSSATTELYEGSTGTRQEQDAARARVHWLCAHAEGRDVLDVLCADALASILLAREGQRVVGVDADAALLARAEVRLAAEEESVRSSVHLVLGEAHELPFADGSFNSVLLGDALRRIGDLRAVVLEAARVLKPRGTLVLTMDYGAAVAPHDPTASLDGVLSVLSDVVEVEVVERLGPAVGLSGRAGRSRRPGSQAARSALQIAEERLAEVLSSQGAQPSVTDDAVQPGADPVIAELEARNESLEERLSGLARQHAATTAALEDERTRLIRFEVERNAIRVEADELRGLLELRQTEAEEQQQSLAQLEQRLSHVTDDRERALAESSTLAESVSSLEGQIGELERSRMSAEARLEAAAASNRNEVARLEDVKAQLQRQNEALRQELADVGIPGLERTVETLEQQFEADKEAAAQAFSAQLRAAEESHSGALAALQEELARTRRDVEERDRINVSLERRRQHAVEDWERLESALRARVERVESSVRERAMTVDELRRLLEQSVVAQESLRAELAAADEELAATSERWTTRLDGLESELTAAQDRAEKTTEALQALSERLEAERAENRRLSLEYRDQLRQATKETDDHRSAAAEADRARDRFQAHIEQLSLELQRVAAALTDRERGLREHASRLHEARAVEQELRTSIDSLERQLAAREPQLRALRDIRAGRAYRLMRLLWRVSAAVRPGHPQPELPEVAESSLESPRSARPSLDDATPGPWEQAPSANQPKITPAAPRTLQAADGNETTVPDKRAGEPAPRHAAGRPRAPTTREIYDSLDLEADRRRFAAGMRATAAPSSPSNLGELRLAAVLGSCLRDNLAPICELTTFRPDNWPYVLEAAAPHVLLVEATWVGNSRSWQHRVDEGLGRDNQDLGRLVGWCRERGIATVFWFTREAADVLPFRRAASHFDLVFSADPDALPALQHAVGARALVSELPLAAAFDAAPLEPGPRRGVLYVPTSDRPLPPAQRERLQEILGAARAHGLRILADGHGAKESRAHVDPLLEFFADHVVGCPDRLGRLRAMASSKAVVLAGRGRRLPPSMFEAAACGAAVIVTGDLVADARLPKGVFTVTSARDMKKLLGDDDTLAEAVAIARDAMISAHTYRHRLAVLAEAAGISLRASHDRTGAAESSGVASRG